MDKTETLIALGALAHPLRLDAFRLLVRAGPDGMLAGDLASRLEAKANTLSANLSVLRDAGLVSNRREGRGIRYRARMEQMGDLLAFLMEDCCGGNPDQCRPLIAGLARC